MKLSKRAAKQVRTIEKAFDGIKATIKIYQKNYNKTFDEFDTVDSKHGKVYTDAICKVNSFIMEGNSIMDTISANLNNVRSSNQRFKYMTYNEMCNKKLSQDDVKKICHYLTDVQEKYLRALSHIKEIQFNAMREAIEIINDGIIEYGHKYECRIPTGSFFVNGVGHTKMAWFYDENYLCSTFSAPNGGVYQPTDGKHANEKKLFSVSVTEDKNE